MSSKFLAYGPDRHAIETVMRLHAVKRWHMIDTSKQQTLAEHSANVALLAMMIARTVPFNFFGNPFTIAAAALVHDLEEAFTGDIPTHTKRRLSGIDILEAEVLHSAFQVNISDNHKALIKLCDLADGIRFIRLHGVDLTATHAQEGLEDQYLDRINECMLQLKWPAEVMDYVTDQITFYAYEAK